MPSDRSDAPGWPGSPARWTSSAKTGVGTSASRRSKIWFTISHGILNEVYYPRVDQACTRDLGLIVTDGKEFFSEEKRHAESHSEPLAAGVPAYSVVNQCKEGRYRIEKEILTDPQREVLLQWTRFVPLQGELEDYRLYALLASHLHNRGGDNTAWIGQYKGLPMLFARRHGVSLALACSAPWGKRSVGFVGASDGWQDLRRHKQMTWTYDRAEEGNVALTGEIDLSQTDGSFVLALGFGSTPAEAGFRARASLQDGFDRARDDYVEAWRRWQESLLPADDADGQGRDLYATSAMVLRVHESKHLPGGMIASLSVPWGFSKGDDDLGGYHLIWPRDLAETTGALLAAGANKDAKRVLRYLEATQEADGHWAQNMWLDGREYWCGIQMDETALPILLADLAARLGALDEAEQGRFWPMVRRAIRYIARNGPVTQQDRWEEDPGYSPFTLAAEIAALLAAADMADRHGQSSEACYLRDTADAWNASIERWIYVTGTDLADRVGVEGYYVRVAPTEVAEGASPTSGFVPIKNRPPGQSELPADEIVSPDALALVRFGLRAADDPRVVNTVKVIDALLKTETPFGPAWHRYNNDGYGEREDGSPFDGCGVGRAWPLLTGERAHYELAAGRHDEAVRLLHVLEAFANDGGMIPEQIWDADDIPERELFFGRPSGSAMPLVWAHAEYIKLRRSIRERRVFDMPPHAAQRYQVEKTGSPYAAWCFNHKLHEMPAGKKLRIETHAPAMVHWSADGWNSTGDARTEDSGMGVHAAVLPTDRLQRGQTVEFTFFWTGAERWEGAEFAVTVE